MARRRSGLMALRAALGAVGGGLEGYGQLQEQKRQQAELARQQERQQMLDLATLSERGWTTPEARTAQVRQAAPGLQSALSSATALMRGAPLRPMDMESLQQGAGMYGAPAGEITIGGQRLVLPESSPKRQERLAEFERGERRGERQEEQRFRAQERKEDREARAQERKEDQEFQEKLARLRIGAEKEIESLRASSQSTGTLRTPTEAQEKSYQFARRMAPANEVIAQYGPKARMGRVTAMLAAESAGTSSLLNQSLSPEEQQLVTAIRQFAEPILRKNTGAAFNRQEIRWIEQQVIPLFGDSPEVREYKAQTRQRELDTMKLLGTPAALYYESIGRAPSAISTGTTARPPLSSFERE